MKERRQKGERKTNNPSSRRWCFTFYPEKLPSTLFLNTAFGFAWDDSYDQGALSKALNYILTHLPGMRGFLYSLEVGKKEEHPHIQGYFELSRPQRFLSLQDAIGFGVHLEIARASREENRAYCKHTGKHVDKGEIILYAEEGEWPDTSGEESGCYDEAISMLLEGVSILEIVGQLKGKILPQVGNLIRLQALRSETGEFSLPWGKARKKT